MTETVAPVNFLGWIEEHKHLLKPPVDTPHVGRGGTAAHSGQWLQAISGSLSPTNLKLAEDSDALIARFLNMCPTAGYFGVSDQASPIAPLAVATLRMEGSKLTSCDGLERAQGVG